jgi:hypothetical protein
MIDHSSLLQHLFIKLNYYNITIICRLVPKKVVSSKYKKRKKNTNCDVVVVVADGCDAAVIVDVVVGVDRVSTVEGEGIKA